MTKLHTTKNPYHIASVPAASTMTMKTPTKVKSGNKARSISTSKNSEKLEKLPHGFKSKWVSALRGTNYIQGFGAMHNSDKNTFDSIGVAHRIAGVPAKAISGKAYPNQRFKFIPNVLTEGSDLVERLASFNDKGMSFKWIASYIEHNL